MLSSGETALVQGNFTMLSFIENRGGADLERILGFHPGRLSEGFAVVVLAPGQRLGPHEFQLQGSTRWSGGFSSGLRNDDRNELEELLVGREQDVVKLKQKVCEYFSKRGGRTPAKVIPVMRDAPGMEYPDGNALAAGERSGVPQFKLMVPRLFIVVRAEAPMA